MGIFERRNRELAEAGSSVVVASASRIQMDDSATKAQYRKQNQASKWQPEAWRYYDEVGEIWFAHNFVGNFLSRIRIFAALESDEDQPPETIADKNDPAVVEMARLELGEGTGAMLHMLGICLGVPGEGVLLGYEDPDDGEQWGVFSTDQVIVNGRNRWALKRDPSDKTGLELDPATTVMVRIWRNHPRWKKLADSPMRPLLGLCDELQILSRSIRSTGRSRLAGAGLLLWPKEAVPEPSDPTRQFEPGQDSFVTELIEAMTTPIAEEGSAAAVVPLVAKMGAEYIEKVKHMTFERSMDNIEAEQRKEVITRISYGLDIPNEVITGMGKASHWTSWLVDEQTFKAHLEPLILTICSAFTKGFLRPAIEGTPNAERKIVWYDASGLLGHPNRAQDAKDAWDRESISSDALRRYLGFSDTDAPDDQELEQRIAIKKGTLDPATVISLLQAAGLLTGVAMPAVAAPSPAIDAPSKDATPTADSTVKGIPDTMPTGSEVASAFRRNRGQVLTTMDRELRRRIIDAADAAVNRAIERAGAKMRRKVASSTANAAVALTLKDVPQRLVMSVVGQEAAQAFGVDEQSIIEEELASLEGDYDTWTSSVQAKVRALAKKWQLNETNIDFDAIQRQQDDDRHAGWLLLASLLSTLTLNRMFNPHPEAPPLGEHDQTVNVPAGLVRAALARAGGAPVVDAPLTRAEGGVATGNMAEQIFMYVGLYTTGYVWVYGDSLRPFDPHVELDGVEFASFDDPVLANTFDFPDTPTFFPGDHDGCSCSFEPLIEQAPSEEG